MESVPHKRTEVHRTETELHEHWKHAKTRPILFSRKGKNFGQLYEILLGTFVCEQLQYSKARAFY